MAVGDGIIPGAVADAHAEETLSLMALGRPFDGFVEHSKGCPRPAWSTSSATATACRLHSPDAGIATKTHILNLLHRLIGGKPGPPTPIDAPQALSLCIEPKANTARYDGLRRKEANRAS